LAIHVNVKWLHSECGSEMGFKCGGICLFVLIVHHDELSMCQYQQHCFN